MRRGTRHLNKFSIFTGSSRTRTPVAWWTAAPTDNTYGPKPVIPTLPGYIAKAFATNANAWAFFRGLPPRERRNFVVWIHTAKPLTPRRGVKGKRPDTRERRIRESIALLAAGKKLGLK